ncbi:hypothetical protein [Mucilaginibacter sp. OK098]|uniref:hypothetical protein n=1 Tax=Mucilaginibacter sp. OK098 TaxID=1855297 RepID=UPI000916E8FF|nr:hypothetical protein [Mucilaginibacter sp. OK098]SHM82260.1 hypothetical protein SAMN05216524_103550 [Mucilaginibacter sp. OK098]
MSTENQTIESAKPAAGFKTILWSGLVAGILDGIAAIIVLHTWYKLTPPQVMQWIASGAYGAAAFTGGTSTVIAGIFFHFVVAYVLAVIYFFAFPKIKFLSARPVLSGLLFGLGIFLVMNLLVIPASNIQKSSFDPGLAAVSIIWHMVLVGLPISLITKKHYAEKNA